MGQCASCQKVVEEGPAVRGAFPPPESFHPKSPAELTDPTAVPSMDDDDDGDEIEQEEEGIENNIPECAIPDGIVPNDGDEQCHDENLSEEPVTSFNGILPASSASSGRHRRRKQKGYGSYPNDNTLSSRATDQPRLFTPLQEVLSEAVIPEEEDPEAPSDEEEDGAQDEQEPPSLKRGYRLPEPRRLRPVTSPLSIQLSPPPPDPPGKQAIHPDTYVHFQKLQVAAAVAEKHKKRKIKVEHTEAKRDNIVKDRKLYEEFQELQSIVGAEPLRQHRRKDSFDLKDSDSWYFDFQQKELEDDPRCHNEDPCDDESASQASLSLLSEASMEAQRRYFAEKAQSRGIQRRVDCDSSLGSEKLPSSVQHTSPLQDYGPVEKIMGSRSTQSAGPLLNKVMDKSTGLAGFEFTIKARDDVSLISELGDDYSYASLHQNNTHNDYGVSRRNRRRNYLQDAGMGSHNQIDPRFASLLRNQIGDNSLAQRLDRIEEALAAANASRPVEPKRQEERQPVIAERKPSSINEPLETVQCSESCSSSTAVTANAVNTVSTPSPSSKINNGETPAVMNIPIDDEEVEMTPTISNTTGRAATNMRSLLGSPGSASGALILKGTLDEENSPIVFDEGRVYLRSSHSVTSGASTTYFSADEGSQSIPEDESAGELRYQQLQSNVSPQQHHRPTENDRPEQVSTVIEVSMEESSSVVSGDSDYDPISSLIQTDDDAISLARVDGIDDIPFDDEFLPVHYGKNDENKHMYGDNAAETRFDDEIDAILMDEEISAVHNPSFISELVELSNIEQGRSDKMGSSRCGQSPNDAVDVEQIEFNIKVCCGHDMAVSEESTSVLVETAEHTVAVSEEDFPMDEPSSTQQNILLSAAGPSEKPESAVDRNSQNSCDAYLSNQLPQSAGEDSFESPRFLSRMPMSEEEELKRLLNELRAKPSMTTSLQNNRNEVRFTARGSAERAHRLSSLLSPREQTTRGADVTRGISPVRRPLRSPPLSPKSPRQWVPAVEGLTTEEFLKCAEETEMLSPYMLLPFDEYASYGKEQADDITATEENVLAEPSQGEIKSERLVKVEPHENSASTIELHWSPSDLEAANKSLELAARVEEQVKDVLLKYRESTREG